MSKNGKSEEAVFDVDNFSYGWAREWARVIGDIQKVEMLSRMVPREDLPTEEQAEVMVKMTEAIDQLQDLMDKRDELIAEVLVSVPADWIVKRAPDDYDVSKDGLTYLKSWAVQELMVEVMKAQQRSSKN